jgi:isopenicillin-N epimerase
LNTRFANGWDHAQARSAMLLDANIVNLNTGSFGPLPKVVFERVTQLRHRLAEEPMDFLVREMPGHLWHAREAIARFLNADPHRLIFTANVTTSVNLIASSLTLAAPGEILLTDHEYGAMHWCWERAAQRLGLTLRTFPLPILASDPQEIIEAACKAMSARTRLFFFSHVL